MDYRKYLLDSADEYEREATALRETIAAYDRRKSALLMGPDRRDITEDLRRKDSDTADFLDRTVEQFRADAARL